MLDRHGVDHHDAGVTGPFGRELQLRQDALGELQGAEVVDVHRATPTLEVGVLEAHVLTAVERRVHQDVDAGALHTQRAGRDVRLGSDALALLGLRDVAVHRERPAAQLLDLRRDTRHDLVGAGHEDHVRAFPCERQGDVATHAGTDPGDHRRRSVEHHRSPSGPRGPVPRYVAIDRRLPGQAERLLPEVVAMDLLGPATDT